MRPIRIFISSVQREFAAERAALRDYLRGDALMRRFVEVFLFEDVPAADRRADEVYLDEVRGCDVYVGLFGDHYGAEDAEGISPTEHEFAVATEMGRYRLVYVKGTDDAARHPKMRALVAQAQAGLIRKRFTTTAELIGGLYTALVAYLEEKRLLRTGPFDAAPATKATLALPRARSRGGAPGDDAPGGTQQPVPGIPPDGEGPSCRRVEAPPRMSTVGEREIRTQQRVVAFFRDALDYTHLGQWRDRAGNANIEEPGCTEPLGRSRRPRPR